MSVKSIITISREYGSGGKEIGRKLAEELDIPYYNRELITMAAAQLGTPEEQVEQYDEKGATKSLLYSLSFFRDTAMGGFPMSDRIFMAQSEVIRGAADKGPCVIVGRCADFILREWDNVINVFVHAPLTDRVKRACEEYGIAADKAAAEVVKVDKSRAAYYDYYSFLKWGECNHYDLSLNSGVGINNTVKLIEEYVAMREQ